MSVQPAYCYRRIGRHAKQVCRVRVVVNNHNALNLYKDLSKATAIYLFALGLNLVEHKHCLETNNGMFTVLS